MKLTSGLLFSLPVVFDTDDESLAVGDKVVLAKWAGPRDGVAFLVKSAAPQYGSYVVEIRGRSHDQADAACVTK